VTAVVSTDLLAEALFVSTLQPSEHPGTALVRDTVTAQVFHLGETECSARVAQEFGDHPEAAAERMQWCHEQVEYAFVPAVVSC
jgi:hypothetical protein